MSITNEIAGSLSKLTRGVEQIRSEQITRGDVEQMVAESVAQTRDAGDGDGYRPGGSARSGATRAGRDAAWLREGIIHARTGLTTGDSGLGEAVSPAQFIGGLWDRLAARSIVLASGATIVETDQSEIHMPAVTGASTAAWRNEGQAITETIPPGDTIEVKPTKLAAIVRISREATDDSANANPATAALSIASQVLIRDSALKLDAGLLAGSGTAPEPRGLRTLPGAQSVTAPNGADLDSLDPFADAITLSESADALPGAFYLAPEVWGKLLKLHESDDSVRPVIVDGAAGPTGEVARSLFGVPVFLSSQIDTDESIGSTSGGCTYGYLVEPRQLMAVRREDARVEVDYSAAFGSDEVLVRIVSRWGFAVPNPESVVKIPLKLAP